MTGVGPRRFDPFRGEIRDCNCALCRECAYLSSRSWAPPNEIRNAAYALLGALMAGEHRRVERADWIAECAAQRTRDIASACAAGKSELHMFGLHRGYQGGNNARIIYGERYSEDFTIGSGLGMTPGKYARAKAALDARRSRQDTARAAALPSLIEKDARNACTYFRVAGQMCAHHRGKASA